MEDESGTRPAQSPERTRQEKRDESEKSKHETSENELPSTQEKNPIPPGTTQKTS
ncbi:hypothetical protein AB3X91_05340 [Paraburkholderia sp. BR14263]|uniref:hypothetical protein n=1 Tax=unclassified Paraburkholderia TaxID=2615204 RepID=UPI0034CD1699